MQLVWMEAPNCQPGWGLHFAAPVVNKQICKHETQTTLYASKDMNTLSLGCWHGSMKSITGNKYHVFSWRAASPERLEFSLSFSRLCFSLNRFHAILHSSSTYTAVMTQVFAPTEHYQ